MNLRAWWRSLKERNKRETDERARAVSLLVVRDGFIAVMLLVSALVLVRPIVGGQAMDAAAADIVAFFPLAAIFVVGGVIGILAALRGGFGWSSGTATYRGILHLLGTLVGVGILVALSLLGVLGESLSEMWSSLLGVAAGAVIAVSIWFLASRRNQ